MYKEEHMISIIKPRGDIKPNWESANPVLRYREWGVEWEESVGIGDVNIKIGDGVTHWNNLDYAIVNNITKKIVKNFASIIDSDENPIENPELAPGDSVETLFGKIKNKFDYTLNFINALKNMVGDYQEKSFNTGSGTVTASDLKNAIDILEQYKLTTANILDVNDSTNPDAALSANQGRLINNKVNANTNAIDVLNSNLAINLALGNETIASLVDLVPDDSTRKFYVNKKPDGPDLSYSRALLTIEKHSTAIYLQMHINIDNLRYQAFYWGDTGVLTPQIWEKSIGSKYFDANIWQLTNANAISIPENSDMKSNTYKALGVYVCETNVKARNLSNCPTDQAFTLIVYKTLNPLGGYTTQEFRTIENDIVKRYWDGYTNRWYNDSKFVVSPGLGVKKTVESNSGGGYYFQAGEEDDYTRLVINNKRVAVEHFLNGTKDKAIELWDGK